MATTENLVILSELSTDLEAAMVIAALEREGIEAFMKGEFTAGFRAEAPSWPKVEVRKSDYERARAILDSFETKQVATEEATEVVEELDTSSAWRSICRLLVIAILISIAFMISYDVLRFLGIL
jgi:hypothetical protein